MGKRIGWDQPPDPWALPFGRALTDQEQAQIETMKDGVCRLCLRPDQQLVYEHDHAVGIHALRQLTCQRCNCHMTGVDAGRYAIDPATRRYLIEPWHLTSRGSRLDYEPVLSVCVAGLSPADRREVDRLSSRGGGSDFYGMRKSQPQFEHPRIAALVARGDMRPALRLRYLNVRGQVEMNISDLGPVPSGFQRHDLPRVLAAIEQQREQITDEWAHIAADAA